MSLTPPVTSEIIFFISRCVLGTPSFSIILFKDMRSAGGRADPISGPGLQGLGGEGGKASLSHPHPEGAQKDEPFGKLQPMAFFL